MPNLSKLEIALTAAAAGDYADNDVVSASATVGAALVVPASGGYGGSGKVVDGHISSSVAAFVAGLRLWLFSADPAASELRDNVAFAVHADDRNKLLGFLDFDASVSGGGFSLGHLATASRDRYFKGVTHAILQATDAFTNESAGMTYRIVLFIEED